MTTAHLPLSAAAHRQMEGLVERIEANPGRLISPGEMAEATERIDLSRVEETLPDGLSRIDLVQILRLAMLTECATESYASVFREGARTYHAPWLARFTDRTWVPDELTHAMPYRSMLLSLGFSEADLDRQIADTQGMHYEHCCGMSPVSLTTYGMIQEQLTDQWHGLISAMLKPSAPHAAHMANRVKSRETQHMVWYRDMTAVQVADNPGNLSAVADAIMGFEMPGATLLPDLQGQALEWMPHMKADFGHVARELVRNFSKIAGDNRRSGELLTAIASRRGYSIGPVPLRFARALLSRVNGLGYQVLGEAIKERVGLSFATPGDGPRRSIAPLRALRARVRTFVAQRIDLRAVTGETSVA